MATRALALELVHGVRLEDTEEAEVVDAAQILYEEIQLLLLHEQLLIVGLVLLYHAFLFFFAFVHVVRVLSGLGRGSRLQLAALSQLVDALLNLRHTKVLLTQLIVQLANEASGKVQVALDTLRR